MADYPKLTFKYGWDDRDEEETPMKGYRSDGIVQSSEGEIYSVYFIDTVRLQQDLEAESESGNAFLAEPGLIILPEVNRESMENAVRKLWEQGYFKFFKSLEVEAEKEIAGRTRAIA
jgi:hypothetical protein